MKHTITFESGERTCASEPGKFCEFVRTRYFGQKFYCALDESKLYDENGWLARSKKCMEMFPNNEE
jgi:hypothetical protein